MNTQTKYFSKIVSPICDIEVGKKEGNYTWMYDWLTTEHIPLAKVSVKKEVYLVPLTETVEGTESIQKYLKERRFKLCEHAPQYLLGLMKEVTQNELPNPSWIVAAEDTAASVFQDDDGDRCFLLVRRSEGGRKLHLVSLGGYWGAGLGWVFLAEKLGDSDTSESLDTSETLTLDRAIQI